MSEEQITKRPRGFIYHLHPPMVSNNSIRFNRTFGLGGMALLLFLLQAVTGILLRFAYVPSPDKAYDSILYINNDILFGGFVRNIHHWSGIFFVLITFLHFVRVFYSQALFVPRRINWIIGLFLLAFAMLSNFTGYLLPWDQLSYWAVTVATNMLSYIPILGDWMLKLIRGGEDVGPNTLLNFYNFHTGVLPITMLVLMVWHFWKVRKAKGVAIEADEPDMRVPSYPNLLLKELVTGLILLAVIFMLSALFNAPLQDRANPAFSPNPAKAPWYFMGIQELLLHIHPIFAFLVLPLIFFAGLIWLPYAIKEGRQGHWFYSEKGRRLSIISAILALILTPLAILVEEYFFHFDRWLPAWPNAVSEGLVPLMFLLGSLAVYYFYLKRKSRADRMEITLSFFTVFVVAYLVLTIFGIWFRGESMQLAWPWNV